jgi:hypothetical protein
MFPSRTPLLFVLIVLSVIAAVTATITLQSSAV